MSIRKLLFAVLLLAGAALARPALPEDELAALAADLADDLEDLDDARAVDEAYERLFATAATPAAATATLGDDDYDGEMPQGDQPMPDPTASDASINASAESTAATSDPELTAASGEDSVNGSASTRKSERESIESPSVERDRELRLQNIKSQVLSYLGLSSHSQHPMSNISASQQQLSLLRVVGRMNLPNLPPQDIFAEKVQSHYPSCSLPRNTDETLWSGGSAMHLLFDLPNHPPPAGTSVNVVQATLRLYKVSQSNATLAAPGPLCLPSASTAATPGDEDAPAADAPLEAPLETPLDQLSHQLEEQGGGPLQTLLGMATADDRQVRVSVYWYTRSLKKNKNGVVVEKRKLLDSRMLPVHGSAWTEWNVRMAVKVWRESGRNFGLVVEVEDEDGTLLDAHQFFNGMNCTQEASTARPLPSFLLDAARRLYSGNASGGPGARAGYPAAGTFAHAFNQNLFPVIDLCTVETTDGSGGALYSSGYDTAPLAASRTQQQPKLAKHRAHPAHPQPAKHRQGDRQGDRPPHHKHRHQHQDHDDSREHEEHQSEEPQARRWPRARSGPQGDAQAQADDEDIRQLIIPRGIVMTAKHVQHVTRDTARAR